MRTLLFTFLIFFFTQPLLAETNNTSRLGNLSLGIKFNLNFSQAPRDFAAGIELNSPLLFNRIGISSEIDYSFLRGIRKTAIIKNEEVFNYMIYKLGILISPGSNEDFVRPYFKTGWLFIDSKDEIFSKPGYTGIYGSFGMNISFEKLNFLCFFLEISSCGIFEEIFVEKLTGNPIFGEGIIFSSGFKIFL